MDQIVQRVEWRYVLIMNGVQCVMTLGITMMLMLYADKLGIIPVVSCIYFKFAVALSILFVILLFFIKLSFSILLCVISMCSKS